MTRQVGECPPLVVPWLTPAQAGRLLGVTPQWARRLAQDGRLEGVETPLGWLIEPESVRRMATARGGQA